MSNDKARQKNASEKYNIDFSHILEEGGNAKIYDATEKATGKSYVLKYLSNCSLEKKQRFIDEIKVLQELNVRKIEGVVKIIDFSEEHLWYVMPKLQPAFPYISQQKSLDVIVDLFISLVNTLISIHHSGFAHRDIKPDNIYIDNGKMILGDFGLVEFPDDEKQHNLTRTDKALGAIFTIAPEMKRNPVLADGKKADVYSLAKTLWMFLASDTKGFEGSYNFFDESHSLRIVGKYAKDHLVEIEELFLAATNNVPDLRPDMDEFLQYLQLWKNISSNEYLSQISNWNFITKLLFGKFLPQTALFNKLSDIKQILKIISKSKALNHMLFANGGGADLIDVEVAKEKDCLYLHTDTHEIFAVSPKQLYFYSFSDVRWNFFLLELNVLTFAVEDDKKQNIEIVVEDTPGHYVSAKDAMYGIYDYETGKKLPEGYKIVNRCIREKLLFVMKTGPYNSISATYDGRHGDCSSEEFFHYVNNLLTDISAKIKQGIKEFEILSSISKQGNPFKKDNVNLIPSSTSHKRKLPSPIKFIKKEYSEWNFYNDLIKCENKDAIMRFYFALKYNRNLVDLSQIYKSLGKNYLTNTTSEYDLFVMKDGKITKCKNNKSDVFKSAAYFLTERNEAIRTKNILNSKLFDLCSNYEMYDISENVRFEIICLRYLPPTHLFTKKELHDIMKNADDRVSNRIVVDESGHVLIIGGGENYSLYPVANEMYNQRNNYVGKYSPLNHLDNEYKSLLNAWLHHLREEKNIFCNDFYYQKLNIEKTIKQIEKYY